MNVFENSYRPILMCGAEKWTRAVEDISRKALAQIRFLSIVGRTRRERE
jgi:hypothetical protein